ncbi:MAG: AhpC/TSA family protein [Prevotella sp.]|nr:AhpC/TSA family protein [Prevotella sp.]
MMKTIRILMAATVLLLVASCTPKEGPSKKYEIKGTAEFADGSILLLTDAEGQTLDTIVVKDGKFSYSGPSDSVRHCSINVESDPFNSVSFLTEEGVISINIAAEAGKSTIAGTEANDALQKLSEETNPFYDKIHDIERIVYSDTVLSKDSEWALAERYMQLYNEVNKRIQEAAEQNIGNELGYMLLLKYIDPQETPELVKNLLAKLPEKFRQRQQIADLEAVLKAGEAIEKGQTISDFALNTPQGEPLSVMSEVSKNKVTILDFWASWCGPCRNEMPFMKELYTTYRPKGLGIVGISLDESAADWNRAITDLKIDWPQMSDLKGWECSAAKTFQVKAIPYLIILDNEGRILEKGLRGEELKQFVDGLLQ